MNAIDVACPPRLHACGAQPGGACMDTVLAQAWRYGEEPALVQRERSKPHMVRVAAASLAASRRMKP